MSVHKVRVTTYKEHSSNPAIHWSNTYEFTVAEQPTELAACQLVAESAYNAIRLFELSLHTPAVRFLRGLVSSWTVESTVPDIFINKEFHGFGMRSLMGEQPVSLAHVLRVYRNSDYGRKGYLMLRGALFESEVAAHAGIVIAQDALALSTLVENALVSSGLKNYYGAAGDNENPSVRLALVNKVGIAREVQFMAFDGVSIAKYRKISRKPTA